MALNLLMVLYLILSSLIFLVIFYFPGKLILAKYFPDAPGQIPLALAIGLSLWSVQSYFLHILNLEVLSWLYIIVCGYFYLRQLKRVKLRWKNFSMDWLLLLVIGIGSLVQLMAVFPSGLRDSSGVWFYQINAYDGLYYLGLTRALINHFPALEPGFSGHLVVNYYYFSELVVADVARMFKLPDILLHFQAFPILIALTRGLLAYYLGVALTARKSVGRLFAFFCYFGSDVGYLISLIFLGSLSVTNIQAIDSASLLLTNPPRAFAEVVFLAGLILLVQYLKDRKQLQFFITSLILVSTIGFKVYLGIFSALILLAVALVDFSKLKHFMSLVWLVPSAVVGLIIYLPTNSGAGGLFWSPFSWPRHYFASTSLKDLNWQLKEQVYQLYNNNLHLFVLHLQETLVFIVSIFGTRLLGLVPQFGKFNLNKFQYYLIYLPSILFILVGLFFLQKTGLYNTFNFFSVSALTLSLLAACLLGKLERDHSRWFVILTVVTIILTLPRPISDVIVYANSTFTKQHNAFLVTNDQLAAFQYINDYSPRSSLILVGPTVKGDGDSPYIEYFSGRSTYLSNLGILHSHNQPTQDREKVVSDLWASNNKLTLFSAAKNQGINLIYLNPDSDPVAKFEYSPTEVFFRNSQVLIVKVD